MEKENREEQILVSEEIFDEYFCCNINKCKGICCVEGDYGAPLEQQEIEKITKCYDNIKDILPKDSIEKIEKNGFFSKDNQSELVTPVIGDFGRCVYAYEDDNEITKCAFEQAFIEGKTNWNKPISCYLYPIRINKLSNNIEALNYHRWKVCSDACELGKNLKLPIYKFLKEPLIFKYGRKWYDNLLKIKFGE